MFEYFGSNRLFVPFFLPDSLRAAFASDTWFCLFSCEKPISMVTNWKEGSPSGDKPTVSQSDFPGVRTFSRPHKNVFFGHEPSQSIAPNMCACVCQAVYFGSSFNGHCFDLSILRLQQRFNENYSLPEFLEMNDYYTQGPFPFRRITIKHWLSINNNQFDREIKERRKKKKRGKKMEKPKNH